MTQQDPFDFLEQVLDAFIDRARGELEHRLKSWRVDLAKKEIHEVLGALLARQVSLATQLARCPSIWNDHVAPLVLRAMADVYISLIWITKDPVDRAQKFILYGLGQVKLQIEHRRAEFAGGEPSEVEKAAIEATEAWVNAQRLIYLTEVKLGSWSGVSTREMAEQAECLDFYNLVYTPFSACTHSMWHHVAKYNLRECANPLHQYHQVPYDPDFRPDAHYLYLAGKYLQKALATFDEWAGIAPPTVTAFGELSSGLDRLSGFIEERERSAKEIGDEGGGQETGLAEPHQGG